MLTLFVDEERNKIFRWLSKTDPFVDHNAARARHEPETGGWLIDSKEYLSWKKASASFLWLHGIPGSGKSILWRVHDLTYLWPSSY